MKKAGKHFRVILILTGMFVSLPVISQEDGTSKFSAGADLYSSYIWRGTQYGTGPAFQPVVKFNSGVFTAGCWGSFDFNGYKETDLFFLFSFKEGLSLGMTDYYYPSLDYFDYSKLTGSHALEINAGFSKGGISLSANYIINEAGGAGSNGNDKYFEAKYSFSEFNIFVGAGDGWHSVNASGGKDRFAVCNVGLGTTRQIKITDSFSLPVTGQVVFNPDNERLYAVAGITF
jgi:hypothetical protein